MKSRGYEKPLYILPFDHRHSFQTKLFGWIGDLNADQTAQMAEARVNHERQIHRKSGSYHRRVDRYRFSHGQTIRPGRDGSCILITGRRKDALDRAAAEIGRNITAVQGDVASLTDLDRLYAEVARLNRKIDVVFANAGVAQLAPIETVDEKFYDLHFDANVKGIFFTVQKALPFLNDGGSIILTGSIADVKGFRSISVYGATKTAIRSFARTWTTELKGRYIRVNTISPGHIDTPIFDTWQGDALTRMKEDLA